MFDSHQKDANVVVDGEAEHVATDVRRTKYPIFVWSSIFDAVCPHSRLESRCIDRHIELDIDAYAAVSLKSDFVDAAISSQLAVVDDDHPVADSFDLLHDVSREHDSLFASDIFDEVANFDNLVRVEARSRFVEDDHFRVRYQGLSYADTLTIAFGQSTDKLVAFRRESGSFDDGIDTRVDIVETVDARNHCQVFADIHVEVKRIMFGQIAYDAVDVDRTRGGVEAAYRDASSVGLEIAGDDLHHGRLSGAIRSEKSDNLPVVDR